MHRRTILSTVALTVLTLSLAPVAALAQGAPQQQRQAQQPPAPPKPMKELIVGSWTLLLSDTVAADGTRAPNYGPNPRGMAIFTPDGRYSLQIMRDIRPKFAANDRLKGTADEYKAASQGMITHFGRYTVDEGAKTLTLRLESSSYPNWNDTTQTRPITALTDDVLTWITPVSSGGGGKSEIAWRRAK